MRPVSRLTLTCLLVASACRVFAASPGPSMASACTEQLAAVMADAQETPWDDLVAYSSIYNYSQGFLATYMAFHEGPAACSMPKAVGVEVSNDALFNLPGVREVAMQPPEECWPNPFIPGCFQPHDSIFLPFFHDELGLFNPFMVMGFDWQPMGHDPPGVYTSPHIDFHFYLIPQEQVMNITAGPCSHLSPASFAAANQPMSKGCFPGGGYMNIGATTPQMGNHILDMGSPEMKARQEGGDPISAWNQTWIWGGLDGQVVFFEAMAQTRYLKSQPEMCSPIPGMPSAFAISGFKPHTYCILSSTDSIRVELRDFSWYEQGCQEKADAAPASFLNRPPNLPPLPSQCSYPKMGAVV